MGSDIERFTFEKVSAIGPYMGSNPNGQWCQWEEASARIAALEATERELREAVKVLASDLRSYIEDQAVGDWTRDISDEVNANPIAAAAVREAGR